MEPARAAGTPAQVALLALAAGNDIQLEPVSLPESATALQSAMHTDPAARTRIQAAATRVLDAKARLSRPPVPHPGC